MNRIIDWVKACDTKASIMLALIGVLISLVFSSDFVLNTIHEIFSSVKEYSFQELTIRDINFWGFFTIVFWLFSLYFLLGSIYRFILVVYSKHQETQTDKKTNTWIFGILGFIFNRRKKPTDLKTKNDSLISLNHIADLSISELKNAVSSTQYTSSDEEDDYLSQILINAKRCKEKFEDYNSAIRWILYSSPFLFVFYICLLFY